MYHDGQFDDARLVIELAGTAAAHGAALVNRLAATGFTTRGGTIAGVVARDEETGATYEIEARVVRAQDALGRHGRTACCTAWRASPGGPPRSRREAAEALDRGP